MSILENPFFAQYTAHAMGHSPLWAVYWEGTEGIEPSHWPAELQ